MSKANDAPEEQVKVRCLILDAGPLITQTASTLQQYARMCYTTPGVRNELKDEYARQQLLLWGDELQVRQPKPDSIRQVSRFAKLTGDYAVLSANDLHIIALAYELECELNNGDWRLRKHPGEELHHDSKKNTKSEEDSIEKPSDKSTIISDELANVQTKKPRRRGGKKQREKRQIQAESKERLEKNGPEVGSYTQEDLLHDQLNEERAADEEFREEYEEYEDDGEWITPDNFQEQVLKDKNENIQETSTSRNSNTIIKVAFATGDFACQNVSMQIGLNLMNEASGKQIKRIRNYMYRCHACFRLTPMPKDGRPKHFCPNCGGNTLLRCAVSVDNKSGKITPHLKANFQWIKRGEKYSLPSPLSHNQQKILGHRGHQHNKQNRHSSLQEPLILREDQKEYQQAIKNDEWQRRQNEKMLEEWVGGGSADNYVSPFNTLPSNRASGVKVGRSRYVNSSRGKRK
ncbi:uncharacterized protein PRCAT00002605001 [Priceomyces carsonii]|uniref:uncharacterized protein n=1 Tax=Priceomyces carsonii TaxID=28549 RepID=UPI002ED8177A|nr:unnamed protein product [Priceomyces carsonii]